MSTDVTSDKEVSDQKDDYSVVRVRNVEYKLDIDESKWKDGPQKFAQAPAWAENGLIRPPNKRGLPTSNKTKWLKKIDPLQNFQIFPSVDPYPAQLRELFRVLNEENPWIERSQTIIQQLVVRPYTTEILPRKNDELNPDELAKWQETPMEVDFFDNPVTPNEIKKYIDEMMVSLDLKDLIFDAYSFLREQGRTAIAMFPEGRNEEGKYVMPEVLRLLRPEWLRRPIINFDTSELVAVEVTGLTANGSRFDANRLLYMFKGKNHDLFSDFYGKSDLRSVVDVGKVQLIIYGRDYEAIVLSTYHTPFIFKHNVPGKDFSQINKIMDDFNTNMANNLGKDISVSHNVELLNPTGTNSGDITGVVLIDNQCIETIAASTNVPLFQLAKGKAGNLGGNANQEENNAFLQNEIEPDQEMLEQMIERQLYDRIIAIMFGVEPRQAGKTPVKLEHNFETPVIEAAIDPEQFNIMMQLVQSGLITVEKAFDRLGIRDMLTQDSSTGGDPSPTTKLWPVSKNLNHAHEEMHQSKIGLLGEAKKALRLQNESAEREREKWAV